MLWRGSHLLADGRSCLLAGVILNRGLSPHFWTWISWLGGLGPLFRGNYVVCLPFQITLQLVCIFKFSLNYVKFVFQMVSLMGRGLDSTSVRLQVAFVGLGISFFEFSLCSH